MEITGDRKMVRTGRNVLTEVDISRLDCVRRHLHMIKKEKLYSSCTTKKLNTLTDSSISKQFESTY